MGRLAAMAGVSDAIARSMGPLPFDKALRACLRPSAEHRFWEPAAAAPECETQDFSMFLRTTPFREGLRGRLTIVVVGCDSNETKRLQALAPLLQVLLGNCPVVVLDPLRLSARDPVGRTFGEAGTRSFVLPATACPLGGGSMDAHAVRDALVRCNRSGPSGASGSSELASTVCALGVTFRALAAREPDSRARSRAAFGLVGSVGLPDGVALACDPAADVSSDARGARGSAELEALPAALLSLPAYPGAASDPTAAAACLARALAGMLGARPCGAARCLFEAAGGSCRPPRGRPLHDCPVCTRKLGVLSAAVPGGMGTSASRIVGRYRALRAQLALWLTARDGVWPPLASPAAAAVAAERVWLRERAASLVVLGVAPPAASDEPDSLDDEAEAAAAAAAAADALTRRPAALPAAPAPAAHERVRAGPAATAGATAAAAAGPAADARHGPAAGARDRSSQGWGGREGRPAERATVRLMAGVAEPAGWNGGGCEHRSGRWEQPGGRHARADAGAGTRQARGEGMAVRAGPGGDSRRAGVPARAGAWSAGAAPAGELPRPGAQRTTRGLQRCGHPPQEHGPALGRDGGAARGRESLAAPECVSGESSYAEQAAASARRNAAAAAAARRRQMGWGAGAPWERD